MSFPVRLAVMRCSTSGCSLTSDLQNAREISSSQAICAYLLQVCLEAGGQQHILQPTPGNTLPVLVLGVPVGWSDWGLRPGGHSRHRNSRRACLKCRCQFPSCTLLTDGTG